MLHAGDMPPGSGSAMPVRRPLLRRWWITAPLGVVALCVLVGLLFLGRWWRTTPVGFEPEVKVSLLDLLQARSLATSARRLTADQQLNQALEAWMEALANNMADLDTWRAVLREVAEHSDLPADRVRPLLQRTSWFLRLGNTNSSDLLLAARACATQEDFERLLSLLSSAPEATAEEVELLSLRLQAAFRLGRMHEFIPLYRSRQGALEHRRDFELYALAYRAGWGQPKAKANALEAFQQRLRLREPDRLTAKLAMVVAYQARHVELALAAKRCLDKSGGAAPSDRALLWLTLTAAGREQEALQDIRVAPSVPNSATDLNLLSSAWMALGLTNRCVTLLARWAPALGRSQTDESANVWMGWAALLMYEHDWPGLRGLAKRIRDLPGHPPWLLGYADFVEGYAAHHLAQGPLARARLERAADASYPLGNLGIAVANGLSAVGRDALAERVLAPLADRFNDHPAYWRAVWTVAFRRHQDSGRLLAAASRLLELEPDRPVIRFNYAGALLVRRERPAEALRIFWDLRQQTRRNPFTELNFAVALVRNGRLEEASALLDRIHPAALTALEKPTYQLARLELCLAKGTLSEAREALSALDRRGLFPCQRAWLEQVEQTLSVLPPRRPDQP